MRSESSQVGFSQRVQLRWMEQTASYVLAGMSSDEVADSLRALLKSDLSVGGSPPRGNREKTITILKRIWLPSADGRESLRQRAFALMQSHPKKQHLVLHWGMTMAVYPFWGAVAESVGRLIDLQGSVVAAQAQRRVRERYGERETVARSARRVIRCFVDWGVLRETDTKGRYVLGNPIPIEDGELAGWLIESLLHSLDQRRASMETALGNHALFPFKCPSLSCDQLLSHARGIEAIHRGLDSAIIAIR